jgi:hypothetical protein
MQQQQEVELLEAFREMHEEDREILLAFAQTRAARQMAGAPKLRLIVSRPHPTQSTPLSNTSR